MASADTHPHLNRAGRKPGSKGHQPPPPMRRSVDLRTLASMSGIPYSTLRQWIKDRRLPAYKVANARIRVYVDEFEKLFVPVEPD